MNLQRNNLDFGARQTWIKVCALVLWVTGICIAVNPAWAAVGASSIRKERPLRFELNRGQFGDDVSFVARGANYCLSLTPREVRVELQRSLPLQEIVVDDDVRREPTRHQYARLRIELLGANSQAQMTGQGEVAGHANYFVGNDPTQWRAGIPAYQKVRVAEVYPGIDLVHYGNRKQLEYDFEVAPGVDPAIIGLRFIGAKPLELSEAGELIIRLGEAELRQPKPVVYQMVNGTRSDVSSGYKLIDDQTVKFALGTYDVTEKLIIDPVVSYSTYFDAPGDDRPWAIAIGPDGDVYLAGETMSTSGFATPGAFQTNLAGVLAGHGDAFVSRHKNTEALTDVYVTYLGGIAHDVAFALAVDTNGNAIVTGYTASTNFPLQSAIQTNIAGSITPGFSTPAVDCFITKVGPFGTNLVFSTFYGGSGAGFNGEGDDVGRGVAIDGAGGIYVAGTTFSTNLPTANTAFTNLNGLEDGFVVKLDSAGTNLLYAMYLGGTNRDYGRDIAMDASGNPVVVGYSSSGNFPVTPDATQSYLNQTTNASFAEDGFVARLQASAGTIAYATYLGGTNTDRAIRVATDTGGAIYVTGWTQSGDFPQTSTNFPTVVATNPAASDVFVTKIAAANTNYDYSVVFGGAGSDRAWDIAVDSTGQAQITGETTSFDFPTNAVMDLLQATNAGGIDAFVAALDSSGSTFVYSAYLGGPYTDRGYGVAVDLGGNAYFTGETIFSTFPTTSSFLAGSDIDPFVVKLGVLPSLSISAVGADVQLRWPGDAPEFSLESTTNLFGSNSWALVTNAIEAVFTNGFHEVRLATTNSPAFFRLTK